MFLIKKLCFILCLFNIFPVFATPITTLFEQTQAEYERGHFELAIHGWEALLEINHLKVPQTIEILIPLARAYQALGLSQQALDTLLRAESLANSLSMEYQISNHTLIWVKLFLSLSDIFLVRREDIKARFYANKSLKILPPNAPILIRATVFNNLGNVLTVEAYYTKAVKAYARCVELAKSAGDAILGGRAFINMAHAHLKQGQGLAAVEALSGAQQQFESLDLSYAKAFGLISLGELAQRLFTIKPDRFFPENLEKISATLQNLAYQSLNKALNIAKAIDNPRLISYAYGFLGHLYETRQRYSDALPLTRRAIFYAKLDTDSFFTEQNQASEILYRWQWQLGRLFKALHHKDKAIEAYQTAVKSLQPVRQEIAIGYRNTSQSFREQVGPVYFELADLLLQPTANFNEGNLKEAINTIERFKTAELQDYFQDDCVTQFKRTLLHQGVAPHTAVVYPIILPDRIEILLNLSQGIQRFTVPIRATELTDEVNEFRFELEAKYKNEFLPYAKRLYRWLIAPLLGVLHTVDTLIIVPDGVLRTIPFAALHDGKQFLISQYALVTMPGLTFTEFNNHSLRESKILLSGLSESVQGHSALYHVPDEMEGIAKSYHQVTQLLDQDFTVEHFADALKQTLYSIVHIASHSQFESNLEKTFLLTYDGKLTMNHLEALIRLSERRQEPLTLLTLSACQTAVGDDKAALGIAGIALKAGARSALASLWFIDDKATSHLMKKFYQQWQKNALSKAKALQAAQQYLLKQPRYQHPAYWASFLLIGDWR